MTPVTCVHGRELVPRAGKPAWSPHPRWWNNQYYIYCQAPSTSKSPLCLESVLGFWCLHQEPPRQISPQGKAESTGRQVWVQRPHEILASQQWLQHSGSTFACSQAYRSHAWRGLPPALLLDFTHFPSWNVCIHPLLSHPVSIQLWPKHCELTLTSYASGYDKVAPDSLLEEHMRHRCWPWDENGNHKWSAGVAVLIAPFWLRENRAHSLSGTTPFSIICKIRIQFEDPPGWENCISRWSLNTYLVPGMKIPVDLAQ